MKQPSSKSFPNTKYAVTICIFLVIGVLAAYAPVWNNEFLHYDDQDYITENHIVQQGLTIHSIRWAFTTGHASNWHPLTWLSHMADCELFRLNPRGHHAVNLLFHACNAILLFLFLWKSTGWGRVCAFAAAVFALHPVHVESVAWSSERKDVVSTFFFLLTVLAYLRYSRNPNWGRYLAVFFLFALGLTAKPMLVTLPFVLLLLDLWPLNRIQFKPVPAKKQTNPWPSQTSGFLIREKIPLFCLSILSCLITYRVQQSGGAMQMVEAVSTATRLGNALIAYATYLMKYFYPAGLAAMYPYPTEGIPLWKTAIAAGLLLLPTLLFLFRFQKQKFLLIGWLFFLGTLIPVIGLIQIGAQAMADRYLYIPSIGILICLTGLVQQGLTLRPALRLTAVIAAFLILFLLASLTIRQSRFWKDDGTLFAHALRVTRNNYTAHNNYSLSLMFEGKLDEALYHAEEAICINPRVIRLVVNAGLIHEMKGNFADAERYYQKALSLQPDRVDTLYNLSQFYILATDEAYQKPAEALSLAEKAAKLTHYQDAKILDALALAHWSSGNSREASMWAGKALAIATQRKQRALIEQIEDHIRQMRSQQR